MSYGSKCPKPVSWFVLEFPEKPRHRARTHAYDLKVRGM